MPTHPCMLHSQGTLPTFRTRDGRVIEVSNGCVQWQGPRGMEVLAWSPDAETWLRANVPMSERLAEELRRMRLANYDTPRGKAECKRANA